MGTATSTSLANVSRLQDTARRYPERRHPGKMLRCLSLTLLYNVVSPSWYVLFGLLQMARVHARGLVLQRRGLQSQGYAGLAASCVGGRSPTTCRHRALAAPRYNGYTRNIEMRAKRAHRGHLRSRSATTVAKMRDNKSTTGLPCSAGLRPSLHPPPSLCAPTASIRNWRLQKMR